MFGRGRGTFRDRRDAGRRLAERLAALSLESPVVLGLPRGGVVVAAEVARELEAPLDVIVVRKLGAPGQKELAVGAIASGDETNVVRHEAAIAGIGVSDEALEEVRRAEAAELRRRERAYRPSRSPVALEGREVVIVDDGIATGSTVRAAILAARRRGASRIVLGVPVSSPDALASLRSIVDDVVCLHAPDAFQAVGQFYADFSQTTDEEVTALLAAGDEKGEEKGDAT